MPGIIRPRSFKLQTRRVHDVTIGMKEFMHKPMYTGMSADGIFAGPPSALFARGIVVVELAPAFEMKAVNDTTIRSVKVRYESAHQRVDAVYSLGEVFIIPFLVE